MMLNEQEVYTIQIMYGMMTMFQVRMDSNFKAKSLKYNTKNKPICEVIVATQLM